MKKIQYVWMIGIVVLVVVAGCTKTISEPQPISIDKIKKVQLEDKVSGGSYCNGKTLSEDKFCRCQDGYVRFARDYVSKIVSCVPEICTYIQGTQVFGDLGAFAFLSCVSALEKRDIESCNELDNQDNKDICYLAYVSLTSEKEVCSNIINQHLKNECKSSG